MAKNRVHLDVRAAPGLQGDERMASLEAECERPGVGGSLGVILRLGQLRERGVMAAVLWHL